MVPGETKPDHDGYANEAENHECGEAHRTGKVCKRPAKAENKQAQDQAAYSVSDVHGRSREVPQCWRHRP